MKQNQALWWCVGFLHRDRMHAWHGHVLSCWCGSRVYVRHVSGTHLQIPGSCWLDERWKLQAIAVTEGEHITYCLGWGWLYVFGGDFALCFHENQCLPFELPQNSMYMFSWPNKPLSWQSLHEPVYVFHVSVTKWLIGLKRFCKNINPLFQFHAKIDTHPWVCSLLNKSPSPRK